jgi:hypothetical protein
LGESEQASVLCHALLDAKSMLTVSPGQITSRNESLNHESLNPQIQRSIAGIVGSPYR